MTRDEKQIIELFLRHPGTDRKLTFVSPLVDNGDGTSSFQLTSNRKSGMDVRVTFKIEEITKDEPIGGNLHEEYNGALEWAANWLMSQAKAHDPHTQSFADNIAASFLAHKKPWKK